jgi:hypothetical protein
MEMGEMGCLLCLLCLRLGVPHVLGLPLSAVSFINSD